MIRKAVFAGMVDQKQEETKGGAREENGEGRKRVEEEEEDVRAGTNVAEIGLAENADEE